jgi:hypothetical protein
MAPKAVLSSFQNRLIVSQAAAAGERDVPEYHSGRRLFILRDATQRPDGVLIPPKPP